MPGEEEQKEAEDRLWRRAVLSVAWWQRHDSLPEQAAELFRRAGWKRGRQGGAVLLQLAAPAAPPLVPALPLRIRPWRCHPPPKGRSDGGLAFGQHVPQVLRPLGGSESQGWEL